MSFWDRRRPISTAALAVVMIAGVLAFAPQPARAAGSVLFDQPFRNNTANGIGAVAVPGVPGILASNAACLSAAGNSTTGPLFSCLTSTDPQGSGKLRLTPATITRQGGVVGAVSVPTSQGLHVTFNTYQYGGINPGADGLAFVLAAVDPANPRPPSTLGQPGGSLGYSAAFNGASAGLSNGYLGIGLDVFGNFSNSTYQGTGCTNPPYISTTNGRVPGQVVVRGPGRNGVGYCAINSTAASTSTPALPLRAATRAASVVPVEVVANTTASPFTTDTGITVPAGQYRVRFTPVGGSARTLAGELPVVAPSLYPSPTWLNASGYPRQLAFGWVASTGSVTDFHEVDNARAVSFNPVPDLNVSQTSAVGANPQPGDPVTYSITAGVDAGATETAPITVTQTVPAGVVPRGAYGSGWVCGAPSGQTISCTNSNGPFAGGTSLPPITVVASVTGTTVTPTLIQTTTVATSSSIDANPGFSTVTTPAVPATAPSGVTVTPAQSSVSGGIAVTVGGSNLTGATAITIGTAAEQQAGTSVLLLPCTSGPAAGCFTVNPNGTLAISSMPARSSPATVTVSVVTRGSAGSANYVYASTPGTPAAPTAVAGVTSATVSWVAPANNGSPITGYLITPIRDGVTQATLSFDASTTSRTLTGLTAGASYTFRVAAVNAFGTGAASPPSAAVVPYTLPGAPTITSATAGTNAATVTWTAPANGGSPITGYTVTPYLNGVAQTPQIFTGTATTQIVTGLTAGATYTFRVAATNAAGTGPQSAASGSVTVNAAPTLTFAPPPPGKAYDPYQYQFTVTGGTGPFGWAVSAGSLPAGLALDPATGLLSGTPTVSGTFPFTVRVTDSFNQSATRPVELVISPLGGLSITVPAISPLGAATAGTTGLSGQLGPVTVTDDRGPFSGNWVTVVSSTSFTTGAGSPGETIPNSSITYASGAALAITGVGTFVPQPGAVLDTPQTAAGWSGQTGGPNSVTWNPTLWVTLPTGVVAGDYTAVVTHSVI
ncbi:fibronectin type III domain-containing protein [Micromonospora sp. LAH09]|uniref:fibronectin type III domain-containing protein n=1 Tax=Micromonospora cabrerizensis TaxID=2911213 RepID=UPI001EE940AF|nr:fibronectin type III domain-containing protein [Micromonospora cabrerizensis]MCG5468068.1 fibronectin type III domain-containing protein [Micromonospora cabrerizensis]